MPSSDILFLFLSKYKTIQIDYFLISVSVSNQYDLPAVIVYFLK